jgi:hypothetical protein
MAKELRTNRLYSPKTIEPKRKREKFSVRDIYLDEEIIAELEMKKGP